MGGGPGETWRLTLRSRRCEEIYPHPHQTGVRCASAGERASCLLAAIQKVVLFFLSVSDAAVDDSFADGRGASAARDFDHSTPTRQVFGVHQQASGPAALLAPLQKRIYSSYLLPREHRRIATARRVHDASTRS